MYKWNMDEQKEFSHETPKGVRKILTQEGKLELNLLFYEPGQKAPLHPHPVQDEVFYILSGEGILTRGEECITVKVNDIIYIPAGIMHDIQNTGNDNLIAFFVKNTPPRNKE